MNREKLHEILDLVLDLNEQGATHATMYLFGHTENVSSLVWEGEEYNEESLLLHENCYYSGELHSEHKLYKFIQTLKEMRDNV